MTVIFKTLSLLYLLFVSSTYTASNCFSCRLIYCENLPLHGSDHAEFVQHSSKFWAYDKQSESWKQADISDFFSSEIYRSSSDAPLNRGSSGDFSSKREPFHPGDQPNVAGNLKEQKGELQQNLYHAGSNPEAKAKELSPFSDGALNLAQESLEADIDRRRHTSFMRFSDASIWITGHSGSIYERFWNGLQWVIIPHDLPISAGYAVGTYMINRNILALSDAGILYQLYVNNGGNIEWMICSPELHATSANAGGIVLRKPGMPSPDSSSLHFATADGSLIEIVSIHPTKWLNHSQPRGGDVAAVVNVGTLRPGIVFTISSLGDLYEYDPKAKPSWKKHIREGSSIQNFPLEAAAGVILHGWTGQRSTSLFLMTKDGFLVERRLAQSKWRWLFHASPENVRLRSIGPVFMEPNSKNTSLFFTTNKGNVYEYMLPNASGIGKSEIGTWIDHSHPADIAVMSSVAGVALQHGRYFYFLEDGRIGELHFPGQGGSGIGPMLKSPAGKRQATSYTWSILEAPETEGGNAEYCVSEHGPTNCLKGAKLTTTYWEEPKGVLNEKSSQWKRSGGRGRVRKSSPLTSSEAKETSRQTAASVSPSPLNQSLNNLFYFRTLQFNKSLFLLGDDGIATEVILEGEAFFWLKHEFVSTIHGLVGIYNNSLFAIDNEGSLFALQSMELKLQWFNCTALVGGAKLLSGRPWDGVNGELRVTTVDDALFFVSRRGHLLEFKVALRNFAWMDCGHPPASKVAAILDQEVLRHRVIYVVGMDGRLYHYNRVTNRWHTNKQPPDIVLSTIPGVVVRPNFQTTVGSLFLRAEDGSLVEFHWDNTEGWLWIRHDFPERGVVLATAPGPSFEGSSIFVVVSDGRVFGRHLDDNKWVWIDYGYPSPNTMLKELSGASVVPETLIEDPATEDWKHLSLKQDLDFESMGVYMSFEGSCNTMVAPVRPVAFASDTARFLLADRRLADLKQDSQGTWGWSSITETPTSLCHSTYWAAPQS